MASFRSKNKSMSKLIPQRTTFLYLHNHSTSIDSPFKTFDFSQDIFSPKKPKETKPIQTRGSWCDRSIREQREDFLDDVVRRCAKSIRKEDERVKKDLAREQSRVEALLKDMSKPEREKFYHYNVQSRRKFLNNEPMVSRDEVRRLMAENRIKQKQARQLALLN